MALTADQLRTYVLEKYGPKDTWDDATREKVAQGYAKWKASQETPVAPVEAPPELPAQNQGFFTRTDRPAFQAPQPTVPQGSPEQVEKFRADLQEKVGAGMLHGTDADRMLRDFQFGSSGVSPSAGMSGPFTASQSNVPSGVTPQQYYGSEVPKPSIGERVADVFTGSLRRTERSAAAQDFGALPELNEVNWDSMMATLGTQVTGPDETVKILKTRFPNIKTDKDEKGNWIITSAIDGKEYAIKPGMQLGDVIRTGTQIGGELAGGASIATTKVGGMLLNFLNRFRGAGEAGKGAVTELANQLKEYAAGGDINVDEIATAGVLQGGGKMLEGAVKAKRDIGNFKDLASKSIQGDATAQRTLADMVASGTEEEVKGLKNAMGRMGFKVDDAGKVSTGDIDMDFALEYIAKTPPHKIDMNILAGAFKKNPEMISKAEEMGVLDYLMPSELVDRKNLISRKITDASVDADKRTQGLMELAEDLNTRMAGLGLDTATSIGAKTRQLSTDIKERLGKMEKNTSEGYEKLYDDIGDARFDAIEALDEVNKVIAKRGADTPPPGFKWVDEKGDELLATDFERKILKALSPRKAEGFDLTTGRATTDVMPKFARLDTLRRTAGSMIKDPTFSSEAQGYAKKMYSILDTQAEKALREIGGDTGLDKRWKTYKESTKIRKGLEDNMKTVFGRQLLNDLRSKTESAITDVSKGGQAKFVEMVTALPKAERGRYVADALMHTLGNEFSEKGLQSFGSLWKAVDKDKQIKNLLGSNLSPQQMKFFKDVGEVSSVIFDSTKKKSDMSKGDLLEIAKGKEAVLGRLMEDINTSIGTSIIVKGLAGAPVIGGSGSLGLSLGVLNAMKRLTGQGGADASKTLEVLRSSDFKRLLASDLKDTDYMKFSNSNKGKIWWDQIRDTTTSPNFSAFLRQLTSDQPQEETEDK